MAIEPPSGDLKERAVMVPLTLAVVVAIRAVLNPGPEWTPVLIGVILFLWLIGIGLTEAKIRADKAKAKAARDESAEQNKALEHANAQLRSLAMLDSRSRILALCVEIDDFLIRLRADASAIEKDPSLTDQQRYEKLRGLEDISVALVCSDRKVVRGQDFTQRLARSYNEIRVLQVDCGPHLSLLEDALRPKNGAHSVDSLQRAMIRLRTLAQSRMGYA